LITDAKELYFKEEKTKLGAIYIKNPDNPFRPTRLIAAGFSHRQLWSWKNVYRIHMSDVVASEIIDDESVYAAAKSRLANTNGYWCVESPPKGSNNYFYRMYEMYKDNTDANVQIFIVNVEDAIKYKITTRDFIESERKRLGHLFAQFYGSSFIEASGNLFNIESINKAVEAGKLYNPDEYLEGSQKFLLIDPGYGSSFFATLVCQFVMNKEGTRYQIQILHSDQLTRPTIDQSLDHVFRLIYKYKGIKNIGIDGSAPELISTVKKKLGERYDYQYVKDKLQWCKKMNLDQSRHMLVLPIVFNTESKLNMSLKTRRILDDHRQLVAINPKFDKLISSLKSGTFYSRGMLDKVMTPFDDILETFMMMSVFFDFKSKGDYY
jgi:hypothetical protein